MHPNPLFRSGDTAMLARLVDDIGFGAIFLQTPHGPRVAHTPLLRTGAEGSLDRVQFHLSRGNTLTKHLDGATALVTVQGPDGYISPRWYADRDTVPTWDYVAVELEGPVRQMSSEELGYFLYHVIKRHEGRLGGEQWQADEASEDTWQRQFRGIVGFELQVAECRPTLKLSQKRNSAERKDIAQGLREAGNAELAAAIDGASA